MRNPAVDILYRNHQWMVQRDRSLGSQIFLVEVMERDPDDTESGYWVRARELATGAHTMIEHIMEKNWIDADAFESAARQAIKIANAPVHGDLDEIFYRAKHPPVDERVECILDKAKESLA